MADFQFADEVAPQQQGEFQFADEEVPQKDTSIVGQIKDFGMNVAGGAQAAADLALGIPGLVGAATAAATHATGIGDEKVNTGRSPMETLQEIMQSSQASDPTQYLPERFQPKDLRATEGYQAINDAVSGVFAGTGQGWGNIAAFATDTVNKLTGKTYNPATVGEAIDVGVQGSLLASGFLGREGAKPASLEYRSAAEPTGIDNRKGYGPNYDPSAPITFQPGPARPIRKAGERDPTLIIPDMPAMEPTDIGPSDGGGGGIAPEGLTPGYTFKNKNVTEPLYQWDYRKGSDIPGIDFTTFNLEDPEQLKDLQAHLDTLGISADINQARTLAAEMKTKLEVADERAVPNAKAISKRIPPMAILVDAVVNGFKRINASPMNSFVELVPTQLMVLMRAHDRLTEPKSAAQFLEKERSVLDNGVYKGLTLQYWPEEGKIVQTNGHTRVGVGAKHGMEEMPTYVRVMDGKVPEEWQKTAVTIPGLSWEGPRKGQFVKPSDIGLPSRKLNDGIFDPKIKYAPDPTVSHAIQMPAGFFQNNHLWAAMRDTMLTNGARAGLEIMRDKGQNPFYRAVANLMLADKDFNPRFQIKDKAWFEQGRDKDAKGRNDPATYTVTIRDDTVGNEYAFMHEMAHAYTSATLHRFLNGKLDRMHPSYDAAKRMVELWQSLSIDSEIAKDTGYDPALNKITSGSPLARVVGKYGLKDVHEFVAEAFSNPEFQNLLKQISLPNHLQPTKGFKYYWDEFVEKLGNIIRVKPTDTNYLAATLSAGAELMRTSKAQDRTFYALEQKPDTWSPRPADVQPGPNFVQNMVDTKVIQGLDRRQLPEVVKDWTKDDIEDLSDVKKGGLLQRLWGLGSIAGRNMADARTMQAMLENVKGAGILVKNVFDRTFLTNRWVKAQIDETMKGREFAKGSIPFISRFERRVGSRDGIDIVFKTTTEKDAQEALDKWHSSQGQEPLTRSSFKNDAQWNFFNTIINQLQRIHELINDMRMKVGKPYIEGVNNYFPFERGKGDYKVVGRDMMGNDRYVKMFENVGQALTFINDIKDSTPYLKWDEPVHREPMKARETDLDVWAEALRINNKNDALTKLIHKAAVEALTKQGMGGHLLPRKMEGDPISGFLGSDLNVRDAQQGLREYVEYAYNYMGNLQKQLIHKDIAAMEIDGKSLAEVAPNLNTYLNQFMEKAKGSANVFDQSEKIVFGLVSQAFGYGASAPTRATAKLSRFAMTWELFKTGFFVTQPFQTVNAVPHLVQMTGSVPKAYGYCLLGLQRAMFPSEADRAAVNWAIRNQHIDPSVNHLLDEYNVDIPTRLFLKTTGTIEKELVRIPAYLAFESALRDTIKDPIQRYEAAADKMAFSMSMTDKTNSPLVWEKMGLIGQGMKQLKSYSTNIWGQYAKMIQIAGQEHDFRPLATFMGNQVLLGGIKGMVLIPEATATIVALNALTNSNVDTPAEFFLKHGLPTWSVYGLGSTALGRDVSNQVGNPSGFSYLDPIPFKLVATTAFANLKYAVAVAQNQLTDDIRMQTWLANTPSAIHEWVRNRFTQPGQPVPVPGMDMKGRYFRDKSPLGLDTAAITGTRSVEESKADDLQRFFKLHEQRLMANKSQIQSSMVDDLLTGKGLDPRKVMDYVGAGGDLHNLSTDIKQTMIERSRADIYNQIINKSASTAHIKAIQEAQPYIQNMPPNKPEEFKFADE